LFPYLLTTGDVQSATGTHQRPLILRTGCRYQVQHANSKEKINQEKNATSSEKGEVELYARDVPT